jgi:hypothetical protein
VIPHHPDAVPHEHPGEDLSELSGEEARVEADEPKPTNAPGSTAFRSLKYCA